MQPWSLFALHAPKLPVGTYWTLHHDELWTMLNTVINLQVTKKV